MTVADYAVVAEVKAMLPDAALDTVYDALIGTLITASSRAIDKMAGKKPGAFAVSTDVTRYFNGTSYAYPRVDGGMNDERLSGGFMSNVSLWIGELAAAPTSVSVAMTGDLTNYTLWTASDYIMWPYNALDEGMPYSRIDLDILYGNHKTWFGFRKGIQIVGKFGYSTTPPADVKQATLIQVIRWFKRAQLNFQDLAVITDSAQIAYQNKIDSDVEMMVNHYRDIPI